MALKNEKKKKQNWICLIKYKTYVIVRFSICKNSLSLEWFLRLDFPTLQKFPRLSNDG